MADNSAIEWCDATWQVLSGCSPASEGCRLCYSAKLAGTRLKHHPRTTGITKRTADGRFVFNGKVRFNEELLDWPLKWRGHPQARAERRPSRIFVADRSDLFFPKVTDTQRDRIFEVMDRAPIHIFIVLTKRSAEMRDYVNKRYPNGAPSWIWFGVSIEDQENAEQRVPDLLATNAKVRWVSCEPLIGPIDLTHLYHDETMTDALDGMSEQGVFPRGDSFVAIDPKYREHGKIAWVVVGGESGHGARPMHPDWARALRDQCKAASVPYFFKQWGQWVTEDQSPSDATLPGTSSLPWATYDVTEEDWKGDPTSVYKLGKKKSGRLLDGVEHSAFPVTP